jgi:chromosome segregation ATPase
MYNRIEVELRGVQQALQSSHVVSIVPSPSEEPELGDEPAQVRRLANATKARLHRAQEEIEQATQALKQVQEVIIEQRRVVKQEKVSLQTKFEEAKAQIQQEKEQFLTEQLEVKEVVNIALHSVTGLKPKI